MLKFLLYILFYPLSLLPFFIIYRLAEIFGFILNNFIPYRKNVIEQNLKQAFPEKSKKELAKIRATFYRNYCEIFFEGIKILTMSEKTVRKRIKVINDEAYRLYRSEPKGVISLTGHRGNFEYMGQIAGLVLPLPVTGVYRPFKSKAFEDFWREKVRHRFKTRFVPAKAIMKHILSNIKSGLYVTFLNDQNPTLGDQHLWLHFLNKETIFFTAPAKIAIKFKMPVYFVDMKRIKQGYYEIQIIPVVRDASLITEDEIIRSYVNLLEKAIREDPANWLWSHKRWKYLRKGNEIVKEGYE